MPTITFINEKKEVEVAAGANLRAEAIKAGVNIYHGLNGFGAKLNGTIANCHGFGLCGTCRVLITKGMENTNSLSVCEKAKFKYVPVPDPVPCMAFIGNEESMRLACCTTVNGDIEVDSSPELNLFGDNFFS